jgi:iron complex transport system substrate-binding protein
MKPVPGIPQYSALVLLLLATALPFCIISVSAVTVTDDAGTSVTINATPQRIVSLAPSNTEILASLGLLERVVGVTDVCDYPPAVKNIPRIGGYSAISIEKVAAARPDLVLASDITSQETVSRLRYLGLTVVVVAPRNIDHVMRDIRLVGTLTGNDPAAEGLAANLSARSTAAAPASPASYNLTVAHVVWNDPLYVSGNDTLQDDVIVHTGGTNIFADREGWGTVPLEEFLIRNPDIIIVNGGGGMDNTTKDIILEDFMNSPQYASLSAVKNHHVYAVDSNIISRAGPRIFDAEEQVAGIIRAVHDESMASQAAAISTVKSPGFCAAWTGLLICLLITIRRRRDL